MSHDIGPNRPAPGPGHNTIPRPPTLPGCRWSAERVPTARILRPEPGATTSGRRHRGWTLVFEPERPRPLDPLMGWTGSAEPLDTVRLVFPDRTSAIAFAEARSWPYRVEDPARRVVRPNPSRDPVWRRRREEAALRRPRGWHG